LILSIKSGIEKDYEAKNHPQNRIKVAR